MKKQRISIIGPTYPYRGGISQYTDELTKNLAKNALVHSVSFKRLYPGILYPGKSDKVASLEKTKKKNVEYILDAMSFLSWRKAVKNIIKEKPDAVIIMWWTFIWQPAFAYMALKLKRKNIKIIFFCHNVVDHEENWLKKILVKKLIRVANAYIVHSKEESEMLKAIKPESRIMQRPHPIYTHFPKAKKNLKKRGNLEMLYFGLIRPYKGVDMLLGAMEKVKNHSIHLTLVGEVWGSKEKESLVNKIKKLQSKNINIDYNFSYVSEEIAANYFKQADVVVLPYKSATGSGVVTLAYNYNKPVIATKVGGLKDVVIDKKTGWLVPPNSPKSLAEIIDTTTRKKSISMQKNIEDYCRENSWDNMAKEIVDFTKRI